MIDIVKKTLEQFDLDLKRILMNNYLDIILYGSTSLGYFAPNYGDIDFIVVLRENLNDDRINLIYELHDEYRSKKFNNLEYQLEGVYYPKNVLENINLDFIGCYIGTGRKGWRKTTEFQLNVFDLIQIKNNGICYNKGKYNIYEPSENEIKKFVLEEIDKNNKLLDENIIPSHVVIQFAARTIFYIENKRIGSKQESCRQYSEKMNGNELINICGEKYTKNYREIEKQYPDHREIARQSLIDLIEIVKKK